MTAWGRVMLLGFRMTVLGFRMMVLGQLGIK